MLYFALKSEHTLFNQKVIILKMYNNNNNDNNNNNNNKPDPSLSMVALLSWSFQMYSSIFDNACCVKKSNPWHGGNYFSPFYMILNSISNILFMKICWQCRCIFPSCAVRTTCKPHIDKQRAFGNVFIIHCCDMFPRWHQLSSPTVSIAICHQ